MSYSGGGTNSTGGCFATGTSSFLIIKKEVIMVFISRPAGRTINNPFFIIPYALIILVLYYCSPLTARSNGDPAVVQDLHAQTQEPTSAPIVIMIPSVARAQVSLVELTVDSIVQDLGEVCNNSAHFSGKYDVVVANVDEKPGEHNAFFTLAEKYKHLNECLHFVVITNYPLSHKVTSKATENFSLFKRRYRDPGRFLKHNPDFKKFTQVSK